MGMTEIQAFWRSYRRHKGLEHDRYQSTYYRTDPAVSERMIARISAGAKRAIAGPLHYLGVEESQPAVGEHAVLLDHSRRPRLIWRTTGVSLAPLTAVTEEFAWQSGVTGSDLREGYLATARLAFDEQAKRRGFKMHDSIETVFETFEVVWPPAAARRARLLAPQFDQGLSLLRRLEEARAATRDLGAVLGRLETAVITVGSDLRLRAANLAAEELLRRGDGLQLQNGRIRARWPRDERAIVAAVTLASGDASQHAAAPAGMRDTVLALRRDGEQPPYLLRVFALPKDDQPCRSADGLVLLLVDDPMRDSIPRRTDADLFGRAFHLTPAEARLAVHLAAGASLTEAAAALNVTRNTVRTHLRTIFGKTEVRRQSELALLVHRMRGLRLSSP